MFALVICETLMVMLYVPRALHFVDSFLIPNYLDMANQEVCLVTLYCPRIFRRKAGDILFGF